MSTRRCTATTRGPSWGGPLADSGINNAQVAPRDASARHVIVCEVCLSLKDGYWLSLQRHHLRTAQAASPHNCLLSAVRTVAVAQESTVAAATDGEQCSAAESELGSGAL